MKDKEEKLNISTFQLIIILLIFVILIVIGFLIQDYNLKISYYLSVGLGLFTLINMYLTITYYLELRNKQGEKGSKGPKGDMGPSGDSGSCVFSTKCNNDENCENNINDIIKENLEEIDIDFKDISDECIKTPNNTNCEGKNTETIEKLKSINIHAKKLIEKCKTKPMSDKNFLENISKELKNLNK